MAKKCIVNRNKEGQVSNVFVPSVENKKLTPEYIINELSNKFKEKGLVKSINLVSNKEIANILNKLGISNNVYRQLVLWHGSPQYFLKFLTSKIGTGEGAQAFGWGLYFSNLMDVAKHYANINKYDTKFFYKGEDINTIPEFLDIYNYVIGEYGEYTSFLEKSEVVKFLNLASEIAEFNAKNQNAENDNNYVELSKSILNKVNDIKSNLDDLTVTSNNGNLYKATIFKGKSPNQYTLLSWYDKIPKDIISKIKTQFEKEGSKSTVNFENFEKGVDIYNYLTNFNKSKEKASMFLLRAGIDGIKYPTDSISMGKPSENNKGYNYVIFDENAITIEEIIKFSKELKNKGLDIVTGGFYNSKTKEIFINKDSNDILNTAIHEFAHPTLQWLRENYEDKYNAGVELLKKNQEEVEPYIREVKNLYPDLKENSNDFNEEVLAHIIGDNGSKLIRSSEKSNILDWLKDIWNTLKEVMGITYFTPEQISKMTLKEFSDAITSEMFNGISSLTEVNTIEQEKQSIKETAMGGVMEGEYNTPANVYVVFNPNQIKSATDNNGDFSSENNDIKFKYEEVENNEFDNELNKYEGNTFKVEGDVIYTTKYEIQENSPSYTETVSETFDSTEAIDEAEFFSKNSKDSDNDYNTIGIASTELEIPLNDLIEELELEKEDYESIEELVSDNIETFLSSSNVIEEYETSSDYYDMYEAKQDNAISDDLLDDVKNELSYKWGNNINKYSTIYLNEKGEVDVNGDVAIKMRIADHTHNPANGENDLTIVIADNDRVVGRRDFVKFANTDLEFDSSYSVDEIIEQIEETIKEKFEDKVDEYYNKEFKEQNWNNIENIIEDNMDDLDAEYKDEQGNPCAKMGLTNTVYGTNWKLVKDFKGLPKHEDGGVNLLLTDKGYKFERGDSSIFTKKGLIVKAK